MLITYSGVAAPPARLAEDLERGSVVRFTPAPILLPDAADTAFLLEQLPQRLKLKNVSYHPEADAVYGLGDDAAAAERARGILKAHSERVQRFLERAIPSLTPSWAVGTCSFRPLEEQGRALAAHASNELVHFDAGAYGATHGDRILRFFVNLHPNRPRVWTSKGDFRTVFDRWGRAAGVGTRASLSEGAVDRALTGLTRALGHVVPAARMLDSSPYDRAMRRFHNFMKDSAEFQASTEGHEQFEFEPRSGWLVFTDGVSHACISGQFALVSTFVIPLRNCRVPELAPYHVLQQGPPPVGQAA